jgi:hypothetical protein
MAAKENTFGEMKKAIIGVLTLAITTAGGLFIANMEKFIGGNDDVKQEVVSEPIKLSSKDTIVVIRKNQEPVVAKPAPVQKKKEFDW